MPKLDTYVENIQLKSNMVDADLPSADWTALQYPSARSVYQLYDIVHPVGSVICMAENINPADALGIGTWELIDKEFRPQWIAFSAGEGWTDINGTTTNSCGCMLSGHTVSLRLMALLYNPTNDEAYSIGMLNPGFVGLVNFPMEMMNIPFTADGGEVVGNASIKKDGTFRINDGWTVKNTELVHTINLEYEVPIHATYTATPSTMLDSFCNKFYFKRTS